MSKINTMTQSKKLKADEFARNNRLKEARELYAKVCKIDPLDIEAWVKQGDVNRRLGNQKLAEKCCRRAITLQPKLHFAHYILGLTLQGQGKVDEAIESYRKTIQLSPNFANAHYLLGNALHSIGVTTEAIQSYRFALQLNPDFVDALCDLASALTYLGEIDEAEYLLQRALKLSPQHARVISNLASVMQMNGQIDEAAGLFEQALAIEPNNIEIMAGLAGLWEKTGQLKNANLLLEKALRIDPHNPALSLIWAHIARREKRYQEAIEVLERLRKQSNLSLQQAGEINILLGQLYDQTGNTSQVFPSLKTGNQLAARAALGTEDFGSGYLERVLSIGHFLTTDLANCRQDIAEPVVQPPIFLIGFPRSGTTLLEQILDSHPTLQAMEEKGAVAMMVNRFLEIAGSNQNALAELSTDEIIQLRTIYFEEANKHVQLRIDAQLVDKMPLNTVNVPIIWRVFPDAKFILAIRHPCDVCLSCFMQHFAVNTAMASFFSLESSVEVYEAVMGAWRNYVDVLPLKYHRIRYEDLITDLEQETRLLLNFLGLDWHEEILNHTEHARNRNVIRTPSYHQVTQPIYQQAKYRWLRYREEFEPVIDKLRPFIEYFGYEV